MSVSVNKDWKDARLIQIADFLRNSQDFEVTTSYNPATQWLICQMAAKGIPFKLVQMGAGVKMISTKTDICPKCHGTGKC